MPLMMAAKEDEVDREHLVMSNSSSLVVTVKRSSISLSLSPWPICSLSLRINFFREGDCFVAWRMDVMTFWMRSVMEDGMIDDEG